MTEAAARIISYADSNSSAHDHHGIRPGRRRWAAWCGRVGAVAADVVFGVRCAGCDQPGAAVCPTCRAALIAGRGTMHVGSGVRVLIAAEYRGRAAAVVR